MFLASAYQGYTIVGRSGRVTGFYLHWGSQCWQCPGRSKAYFEEKLY